jgi:hypothetical protein
VLPIPSSLPARVAVLAGTRAVLLNYSNGWLVEADSEGGSIRPLTEVPISVDESGADAFNFTLGTAIGQAKRRIRARGAPRDGYEACDQCLGDAMGSSCPPPVTSTGTHYQWDGTVWVTSRSSRRCDVLIEVASDPNTTCGPAPDVCPE